MKRAESREQEHDEPGGTEPQDLFFAPIIGMVPPQATAAALIIVGFLMVSVLTEAEAITTFCANSIVIGNTVVMPSCPDRVRAQLEEWGFEVVLADVSEFHKGGGSIRCLTNPVDVRIGRDLPALPGGEVVLPTDLNGA